MNHSSFAITRLRVDHSPVPEEIKRFLQNHPKSNWFNNNMLIPVPPRSGNSAFMILEARDHLGITGLIVANVYFSQHPDGVNSVPFRVQVNGEPMIREGIAERLEVMTALLLALNRYADEHSTETEFRNFCHTAEDQPLYTRLGYGFHSHLNLSKPLATYEDAWASLSKCRRRQIRKALHADTRVEPAANENQVEAFYNILHNLYLLKINKKLPPLETFIDCFQRSRNLGDCLVLLVFAGEKVIGGIVCLIEPGKVMIEWYICGLDKEFHENYPSVMATWGAIAWACEHHIPRFDFLGLGKPEIPYGVRDFKLRFGGDVQNYGRYIRNSAPVSPP